MLRFRWMAAALLVLSGSPALADVVPRLEITPYVGYRGGGQWLDADGDAPLASAPSYGVFLNYRASFRTQWELFYGRQSTEIETRNATLDGSFLDVDMDTLQFGGTYVFREERLSPFLAMTLGATRVTPDDGLLDEEVYFSASLGLGLRYELRPNLGLRLQARFVGLFGKTNSLVFCEKISTDEVCYLSGDRSVIPQGELLGGLTFRF